MAVHDFESIIEAIGKQLESSRQNWLFGAGISYKSSIPLMYPLTARVKNIIDGYALKSKLNSPSLIGMASAFLVSAQGDYDSLRAEFIQMKEALLVSRSILTLKGDQ